jgi:hypothetical protein
MEKNGMTLNFTVGDFLYYFLYDHDFSHFVNLINSTLH